MENPTLEKLICDESFLNYCFQANREDTVYWQQWIIQNPQYRPLVEEAGELIRLLQGSPSKTEIAQERARLQEFIRIKKAPVYSLSRYRWIGYSAACLLLVAMSLFFYKQQLSPAKSTQSALVRQEVPTGKYMNLLLGDSTSVKLGPTSVLHYPTQFNSNERRVRLNGEAYFEVAHNPDKPFVIETGDLQIKVLGTSFNVHAFENDELSTVALFTGQVEVTKGLLSQRIKPGQSIVYDKAKASLTIEPFDRVKERESMAGILHFERASYAEVARQLSRKYGITYPYPAAISLMYSGTIAHEPLEHVLEKLSLTTPYHFTVKSNTLIVRKK